MSKQIEKWQDIIYELQEELNDCYEVMSSLKEENTFLNERNEQLLNRIYNLEKEMFK